jgi:hypothetical protein
MAAQLQEQLTFVSTTSMPLVSSIRIVRLSGGHLLTGLSLGSGSAQTCLGIAYLQTLLPIIV